MCYPASKFVAHAKINYGKLLRIYGLCVPPLILSSIYTYTYGCVFVRVQLSNMRAKF